jgi:hypothetical protein
MPNNQQSQWVNGQVVNATQMTALTQDLYNKLTFITQNYKPCILYLNGDVTQVDSNVTIPDGAFRFEDSDNSAILQYNTGIFGNAQGTTLAVTGDGYIVARYVLNPIIPNQYNYTFATSYVFVATPIADTDVVICVITAGVISQKSGIFPYQDITDNPTDGNVTIGGRVVNSVNNIKTLGDAGKLSGVVTGNEGSILYVTEPDGETINTAVVNQYGYRPFHNGTATAILDPENTFAYVSELPVVPAATKYRFFEYRGDLYYYLQARIHANYDPIQSVWICSMSGFATMPKIPSAPSIYQYNVDFSSILNGARGSGPVSMTFQTATTAAYPIDTHVLIDNTFLTLICHFVNVPSSPYVTFYFALTFVANEII